MQLLAYLEVDRSSEILTGLSNLQCLGSVIGSFQKDLVNSILRPVIFPINTVAWRVFSIDTDGIHLVQVPSKPRVMEILSGVQSVFSYLKENIPPVITESLLPTLSGVIAAPLIAKWLSPSIPTDVSSLDLFQQTLNEVRQFTLDLEAQGWGGLEELRNWTDQVPRLWLSLRRTKALDDVRQAMTRSEGKIRRVERVEKQVVSADDDMLAENTVDDDWNAEWSDNEGDRQASGPSNDEIDQTNGDAEDEEESWDWNDENDETLAPAEPFDANPKGQKNGTDDEQKRLRHQEVILKESYAITDLPDAIIAIISDQVADASNLANLG